MVLFGIGNDLSQFRMGKEQMVSIVIPAYNEEDSISRVVMSVQPHGTVIVIDDASNDSTAAKAKEAGGIVIRHECNKGYDMALNRGFAEATRLGSDVIVTCDGDGQHDPNVLPKFIQPLLNIEVDMVLGVRRRKARWSEFVFGLYTNWRFGVMDPLCGMKGYRIELYNRHGCFDSMHSIGTELCFASLAHGASFKQVPVPIHERNSKTRFGRSLRADLRILRSLIILIAGGYQS